MSNKELRNIMLAAKPNELKQCLVTCHDYTPRTCSEAHRCELLQGHEGQDKFATHGASRELSMAQLAAIREAVLTVIDDGQILLDSEAPFRRRRPWSFYAPKWREDSAESNEERMKFCDAIQDRLVGRMK